MEIDKGFEGLWKPFRENPKTAPLVLPHHDHYRKLLLDCELSAYLIRSLAVYSMTCGSLGHPGGSFSEADFLAVLYNYALRHDPRDPDWPLRDVFYFSKCHACPGLYATLALFGYFPLEWLSGYGTWGSHLESHPDRKKTPGIEISGGSLGQIAGVAVGRALAIREKGLDHNNRMVYVLLGDGECDEGSVWEAFMAAGHYGLDNLVCVIDYNKVQAKGFVKDDMCIEPLADKLRAFNMDVHEIANGHDVRQIVSVFNRLRTNRRGKPQAVVLNTVKGYGVERCSFNPNWHTSAPRSIAQAAEWLGELWEGHGRRLGVPRDFVDRLVGCITVAAPLHDNPDKVSDKQA